MKNRWQVRVHHKPTLVPAPLDKAQLQAGSPLPVLRCDLPTRSCAAPAALASSGKSGSQGTSRATSGSPRRGQTHRRSLPRATSHKSRLRRSHRLQGHVRESRSLNPATTSSHKSSLKPSAASRIPEVTARSISSQFRPAPGQDRYVGS